VVPTQIHQLRWRHEVPVPVLTLAAGKTAASGRAPTAEASLCLSFSVVMVAGLLLSVRDIVYDRITSLRDFVL